MGRLTLFTSTLSLLFLISIGYAQQPCDIIYVAPGVPDATGYQNDPTNIVDALTNQVSGSRLTVRMLEGTYSINTILEIPADNVIIEGGYRIDGLGNWVKRSDVMTIMNMSGFETRSVSSVTVGQAIGFRAQNVNGWTVKDLTINQASVNGSTAGRGNSVYAFYVNACNGYSIFRCVMTTGIAGNGDNGTAPVGIGGAGGPGNGGGGGSGSSGCSNSGGGGVGTQGNGGASGGGGGGGRDPGCNFLGCSGSQRDGGNGGPGIGGANGTGFTAGDREQPNTDPNDYYIPNAQVNGGNGFGGGGGGGGGGATGGTCACINCGGNNGGTGGTGGNGGIGGNGGYGGGGSFILYATGAGTGQVIDCDLNPGGGGTGGTGQIGQPGSSGNTGNNGQTGGGCLCGNADGGDGGNGGNGGSGGRGRDGANGPSMTIAEYNGATVTRSGSYPLNQPLIAINTMNRDACAFSEISILKISGNWDLTGTGGGFVNDLSPSSSSFNNSSTSANIYYPSSGDKDINIDSDSYTGYISISNGRSLPVITQNPDALCIGDSIQLGTAEVADQYEWSIYNDAFILLQGASTQIPGFYTPLGIGKVFIKFKAYTECCGWSISVWDSIDIQPFPSVTLSGLRSSYCEDDEPDTLSGNPPGGTFFGPLSGSNIFDPSTTGVGSFQVVYSYATPTGCESFDTATVTVLPPPIVSFSGLDPDYCINDPSVTLSGNPSGGSFGGNGVSGNNFVPFIAGIGTHDVTYNYVAANGCNAIDTQSTIVNDFPIINFQSLATPICVNADPATLVATPPGGDFSGIGVLDSVFDPSVAGIGGPYVLSYTFTDTIGCMNTTTANQIVSVVGLPIVSVSGLRANYCFNDAPSLLTGVPTGGFYSGSIFGNDQFYPDSAGTGSHQITYTFSDVNGCSATQSLSTIVNDLPAVTFTGLNSSYCENAGVAILTGAPPNGDFMGPGILANSFDPIIAGTGGPYPIVYEFTDSNSCTNSDTQFVSVNSLPLLSIGGLDSFYCTYQSDITLSPSPAGGALSGAGITGQLFNPAQAGVGMHSINYMVTDVNGCFGQISVSVIVDACVGIEYDRFMEKVSVYPNPTTGEVTVEQVDGQIDEIRVFNAKGYLVLYIGDIDSEKVLLDLNAYPNGTYIIQARFRANLIVARVIVSR